jgi:hypothetical protein
MALSKKNTLFPKKILDKRFLACYNGFATQFPGTWLRRLLAIIYSSGRVLGVEKEIDAHYAAQDH